MNAQETNELFTKKFVIDSISRETLVDLEVCSMEQALGLSDEMMQAIAEDIGDAISDGNDAYWETVIETAKDDLGDW